MKTINFNGYTIVAGQNARENDMLTLQSSGWLQDGAIHLEEEALGGVMRQIRHQTRINPQMVQGMLLDCAVQLSTKAPVYALLVGECGPAGWGHGRERGERIWLCCMGAPLCAWAATPAYICKRRRTAPFGCVPLVCPPTPWPARTAPPRRPA